MTPQEAQEIEDAALVVLVSEGGAVKWTATKTPLEVSAALIQIADAIITEQEAKHG